MPTERARLLELALENLESKKKQIESEIGEIMRELGGGRRARGVLVPAATPMTKAGAERKRSRFSMAERQRRAARMRAYWENWRKQKKLEK